MGEFEISLTFEEWQKKKGEKSWWEVAVLVDYSVAR